MLHCPVTLHLLAPDEQARSAEIAEELRHEHVAMVYAAASPAAAGTAEELGRLLDVSVRVDADLSDLDVAGFGRGAHPVRHCAQALEDIADLHRGEHVIVVGGVATGGDDMVLRRLEIGDDGWDLLD